jgi:hypothetical protein
MSSTEAARDGRYELFKTEQQYDSTARNLGYLNWK